MNDGTNLPGKVLEPDTPTIEMFRTGSKPLWKPWLESLPCMAPTRVPEELLAKSRATTRSSIQNTVGTVARLNGIRLKTLNYQDAVWVLRLEDEPGEPK